VKLHGLTPVASLDAAPKGAERNPSEAYPPSLLRSFGRVPSPHSSAGLHPCLHAEVRYGTQAWLSAEEGKIKFIKTKTSIILKKGIVNCIFRVYFLWQNTLPFRAEMNARPVSRFRRPEGENINPVFCKKYLIIYAKLRRFFMSFGKNPVL